MTDKLLLSAESAAALFDVGERTFRQIVSAAGVMPVSVPGLADRRWRRADLERFVEALTQIGYEVSHPTPANEDDPLAKVKQRMARRGGG